MSKDILVNKGDTLTVIRDISKLVTNLSNGSMATWIPEDETLLVTKTIIKDGTYEASREPTKPYGYSQVTVTGVGNKIMGDLGEKSITKNGVYIAKKDKDGPFYGYSKLYVNVPGGDDGSGGGGDGGSSSPTITGKDADGDDAIVGTDEDGNIVSEKLPTRISINVYPNNLVYEDGQTIDFTGLRVKAFLPDDTEWGIIDDNELIKPVTVAEYSGDGGGTVTASKDGLNFLVLSCNVYSDRIYAKGYHHASAVGSYIDDTAYGGGRTLYIFLKTSVQANVFYTKYSFEDGTTRIYGTTDVDYPGAQTYGSYNPSGDDGMGTNTAFTIGNKAYIVGGGDVISEFAERRFSNILDSIPFSTDYPNGKDISGIEVENQTQQTIPLQWKRPGDGKVLETSFSIAVHGSGDSGSGAGPAPTPSPG